MAVQDSSSKIKSPKKALSFDFKNTEVYKKDSFAPFLFPCKNFIIKHTYCKKKRIFGLLFFIPPIFLVYKKVTNTVIKIALEYCPILQGIFKYHSMSKREQKLPFRQFSWRKNLGKSPFRKIKKPS
ncbi:MAG: hypothetical protein ACUVRN_03325 [Candidatus Caldatribacteriaceae bacterium]